MDKINITNYYSNHETAALKLVMQLDKKIVLGVPLGLGKPIGILNALYRLASTDKSIELTIITGLTLSRPKFSNALEENLASPILERLLKNYEDPLYEAARVSQTLPDNIRIIEFFFLPGKYLHNHYAQQNYICSSYTDVVRDAIDLSINVLAQQVCQSTINIDHYSLSSNSDLFHETKLYLDAQSKNGKKIAIIAEVNQYLPYMYGDAVVNNNDFTDIIDTKQYNTLFSVPRDEVLLPDHLIGLYTSTLIKDNGCLQIGIGKLSNALANALIVRHKENKIYNYLLKKLSVHEKFKSIIDKIGGLGTFDKGLYASTEMMSDEYIHLYQQGILKKKVYDHIGLQKLLDNGELTENITPNTLNVLLKNNIISSPLTPNDVKFLQEYGIFKSTNDSLNIKDHSLGDKLTSGTLIHAGFFLGSIDLYKSLNQLSEEERQLIYMTSVARTNQLTFNPELLALQRQDARFVNSCLMVTLNGSIISHALENQQELSGVGGQFDFVYMATQIPGGYSIITCRSTRETKYGTESNIVWQYPNMTIPAFLRDIVVTEYGIADCRSKTDEDVIKELLNITDSRFQSALLKTAKKAGKIRADYQIPAAFRQNYPDQLAAVLQNSSFENYFKPYPFGSDLTDDEQVIAGALGQLKNYSLLKLLWVVVKSFGFYKADPHIRVYLERMKLDRPKNVRGYVYKKLLSYLVR
ncbi:MAG: acetyl-CoA hydrolase/transferase C-terminal domain-containing protein [Gammaproteobacteria bacterium]